MTVKLSSPRRVFYGWTVVATAATGLFLSPFGIAVFAFGVFFDSLVREFGAGRATISLAFTIHNLVSGLLAVMIGRMCDRYGARKVIVAGLAIVGVVLLSAETIGSKVWQLYVFYAALGAATPATTSIPYGLVVSRWFNRRRGLALGLMMIGLGLGSIVMPPAAQRLIGAVGWRTTFAIAGCAVMLVAIPIVFVFLRDDPSQMDLLPDGAPAIGGLRSPDLDGLAWPEIRRSGTFWRMVAAFGLIAASVHGCIIHLPQLFIDRGSGAQAGAMAGSIAGFALLTGRIGAGYFLDRYFGPRVALVVFANVAVGIALLAVHSAGVFAVVGAFLVGLGMGAEVDVIVYLMGRYFGLRSLGASFGFGFGAFVVAGGLGPLVMGMAFDRTGSYDGALAGFFVASLVATVMIGRLGPYRYEVTPAPEDQPLVSAPANVTSCRSTAGISGR